MRKAKTSDELRPEYKLEDLGRGVRGKYLKEYCKGTNLVLVFSTEEAVNQALRSLISLAEKSVGRTSRSTGSAKKRASR